MALPYRRIDCFNLNRVIKESVCCSKTTSYEEITLWVIKRWDNVLGEVFLPFMSWPVTDGLCITIVSLQMLSFLCLSGHVPSHNVPHPTAHRTSLFHKTSLPISIFLHLFPALLPSQKRKRSHLELTRHTLQNRRIHKDTGKTFCPALWQHMIGWEWMVWDEEEGRVKKKDRILMKGYWGSGEWREEWIFGRRAGVRVGGKVCEGEVREGRRVMNWVAGVRWVMRSEEFLVLWLHSSGLRYLGLILLG